jgi:hypothetical protein
MTCTRGSKRTIRLLPLLLFLPLLAACQGMGLGWGRVAPDQLLVLQSGGPHAGSVALPEARIDYRYTLDSKSDGGVLHLNGNVQDAYHHRYDSLNIVLLTADLQGNVLGSRVLYNSGYRVWIRARFFEQSIALPAGTQAFALQAEVDYGRYQH